ncbi:hypothetical protein SSS_06936 [Sarcoptes scabiei]|uniref:Gustatory receptor n=1 Tax=Sarcoptes scabiei TaxID=52283 RepID=A0A834REH4_SARSC|nr:hypothetical protein SSS_06936 [Sarcoptes scabiei]
MILQIFFPFRVQKIEDIFPYYFQFLNTYLFRWQYSLEDYHRRQLSMQNSNLYWLLLCSFEAWASIGYSTFITIYPDCKWLISLDDYRSKIPLIGLEIIAIYTTLLALWFENVWFQSFRSLCNYSFRSNDHVRDVYVDRQFTVENRKILLKYFITIGYLFGTFYSIFIVSILACYIYLIVYYLHLIYCGSITNPFPFVSTMILTSFMIDHAIRLGGQAFLLFFCFAFTCDLLVCKLRQLRQSIRSHLRRSNKIVSDEILKRFRQQYSNIFRKTSNINHDYRRFFLTIEIISKGSLVFSVIIHSKQITVSAPSIMLVIISLSIFLLTIIIYSRISYFDCINLKIFKLMNDQSARVQFILMRKKLLLPKKFHHKTNRSIRKKAVPSISMKSHYFNQSISTNQIGFTCGTLFYINKNRYAELLLMDIIFVFLFYKKLVLNKGFD